MKHYVSKSVRCPYYHSEEPQRIRCEGIRDGTALQLYFATVELMKRHKRECCCDRYNDCLLAEMHNRRYERKWHEKRED